MVLAGLVKVLQVVVLAGALVHSPYFTTETLLSEAESAGEEAAWLHLEAGAGDCHHDWRLDSSWGRAEAEARAAASSRRWCGANMSAATGRGQVTRSWVGIRAANGPSAVTITEKTPARAGFHI